jgi:hypothetical protein
MMNQTNSKSQFAIALIGLLDRTNLFERYEWAELLSVSEPAISQWVGDKTIPRPENLYMIVATIQQSSGVPEAPLAIFKTMAQRIATEVSPHGKRMLPTVWEYMMRPAFSELASRLAKLSPAEQEKLLEETYLKGKAASVVVADQPPKRQEIASARRKVIPVRHMQETIAEPLWVQSSIYCQRASTPVTCAEQEPTSWKGLLSPTFQMLAVDNTSDIEGHSYEWDQLSRFLHLLIIGDPGSGKTTFLRHLAQRTLAAPIGEGDRIHFPVYLHLGCLSEIQTGEDLEGAYRKTPSNDVEPGRVLLLLDAFDEVPTANRERLVGAITNFQEHNPETRLIITSRPTPDLKAFAKMTWSRMEPPEVSRLLVWVCQELAEKLAEGEDRWDAALLRYVSCLRERPDVFRQLQNPLLLSYSAQLFVRHSLTACHDADLLQECLTLLLDKWDERKNIVRFPDPWARPRHLFQWLSGLCYYTLIQELNEFTSEDVESWVQKYNWGAPAKEALRVLSESTGIVQPTRGGKWRVVHITFQEYLAAKYIIESSNDATHLVQGWLHEPRMSHVLKFACALTHDATHLLQFALTANWPRQADKMVVLADIIAQQFTAETELIEHSCDMLADWLNSSFASWEIKSVEDDEQIPSPRWRLVARKTGRGKAIDPHTGRSLLRSIRAVHRARLSPAKPQLCERFSVSPSSVVRAVGASLEVEGYLQAQLLPRDRDDVLVAQVLEV